jgi:hypothetical protein
MYIYRLWLMKRNLKQWWSTVPSIPTKRTTIAHLELKLLRQNKKHDMMLVTRIDNKGLQFYCDFALFIFDMI